MISSFSDAGYGEPRAVAERQEYLDQLVHEMRGREVAVAAYDETKPQTRSDDEVIAAGYAATNGEKFKTLREGQWRDLYGSQSEADFGYIDMLWFHSRHREQTRRLFRASALDERDKLGAMCRSFTQPDSSGLACHEPGGWHVRSVLATGGAPDDGSDYRMAAGPDPRLAALIDERIAGDLLDTAAEFHARAAGWR